MPQHRDRDPSLHQPSRQSARLPRSLASFDWMLSAVLGYLVLWIFAL
jgi:hypothetical protein